MNKFGNNRSNRWRGKELTRVLNFGRNDEKANKFHKNYEKKNWFMILGFDKEKLYGNSTNYRWYGLWEILASDKGENLTS